MDDFNAEHVSYFQAPLRVMLHHFASRRDAFSFGSETSEIWTLIASVEGAWEFGVGEKRGTCGALEWVLCPPGTEFERRVTRAPLCFHVVRFEWEIEPQICPIVGWNAPRDRVRLAGNLALWREAEGHRGAAAERVREHVLRDILGLTWAQKGQPRPALRPTDAAMEKARLFLENQAAQPVSLADLAQKHRLSPVAFTRRFRAATGQTPSEYLIACRLERARDLLLDSDATLNAIAAQSGFGNGFYLSRVWSKKWGGTPSGFRRARRV